MCSAAHPYSPLVFLVMKGSPVRFRASALTSPGKSVVFGARDIATGEACPQSVPRSASPVVMAGIPTGHIFRVERKRGPVWYAKYRLPDGRQVPKKVGPAPQGIAHPAATSSSPRRSDARPACPILPRRGGRQLDRCQVLRCEQSSAGGVSGRHSLMRIARFVAEFPRE